MSLVSLSRHTHVWYVFIRDEKIILRIQCLKGKLCKSTIRFTLIVLYIHMKNWCSFDLLSLLVTAFLRHSSSFISFANEKECVIIWSWDMLRRHLITFSIRVHTDPLLENKSFPTMYNQTIKSLIRFYSICYCWILSAKDFLYLAFLDFQ